MTFHCITTVDYGHFLYRGNSRVVSLNQNVCVNKINLVLKYVVFSGRYLLCNSPYSDRIRENTGQKKVHIWKLFTQYISFWRIQNLYKKLDVIVSLFYIYLACNLRRVTYCHCVKGVRIHSCSGKHFLWLCLNTERYFVSLRIQCICRKTRIRITPKTGTFYTVGIGGRRRLSMVVATEKSWVERSSCKRFRTKEKHLILRK